MSEEREVDPGAVKVNGAALSCGHCGKDAFFERSALVNTRGMTFLGYDWLNEGARVFSCAHCGHLEWFVELAAIETTPPTEIECLSCGTLMQPEDERCKNCGWTYSESE